MPQPRERDLAVGAYRILISLAFSIQFSLCANVHFVPDESVV
jgi:hypothetical protein